jgi:hypothetical protein
MAMHVLTLDSLQNLDMGKAFEAFQGHLRRVGQDCLDRSNDPKPRKVTFELAVVPVTEPNATCERVKVQIHVSSTLPKHRTRVYDMAIRANGGMVFSEDSPENFDQTTIFDGENAR